MKLISVIFLVFVCSILSPLLMSDFGPTTLSIMPFCIMTFSIKSLYGTLSINDTKDICDDALQQSDKC